MRAGANAKFAADLFDKLKAGSAAATDLAGDTPATTATRALMHRKPLMIDG